MWQLPDLHRALDRHRSALVVGFVFALAVGMAIITLSGCAGNPSQTADPTCAAVAAAQANPTAASTLNAQDPHSFIGVLWADVQSACVAGQPAANVTPGWGAAVWTGLKAALPQLLPLLVGLI